jgi:hypothetical protein
MGAHSHQRVIFQKKEARPDPALPHRCQAKMNTLKATPNGRIGVLLIPLFLALLFSTAACSHKTSLKPDFDTALEQHFAAITHRDIEAFKAHLTRGETLYTIVQNGYAFTTPAEAPPAPSTTRCPQSRS